VNNFLVIDMEGWKLNIKALRDDETVIETFSVESQAGLRLVNRRVEAIGGLPWEQGDDDDDDNDDDLVELEYNIKLEK
jgi:hypothetical protein